MKKKNDRLELLIRLPKEELNDSELLELKQIHKDMFSGEKKIKDTLA